MAKLMVMINIPDKTYSILQKEVIRDRRWSPPGLPHLVQVSGKYLKNIPGCKAISEKEFYEFELFGVRP